MFEETPWPGQRGQDSRQHWEDGHAATILPRSTVFPETDLPREIRALKMSRWASGSLGMGLLVAALTLVVGSFVVNARDSTIIPVWVEILVVMGATACALPGWVLLWYTGNGVTLTPDAAIVKTAFRSRVRVDRTQLEDFYPYLHTYATRGGVQYRIVPTFTVRDQFDRFRDVPLPFLGYWNPEGGTNAPLPPRAAYIEAWARGASSPYSRNTLTGAVPDALSAHRQSVRTGLRRRSRLAAVLIPVVSIGLGVGIAFAAGPVSRALGPSGGSVDAQAADRTGTHDLNDGLIPLMASDLWSSQEITPRTHRITFSPILKSLPPAPYTVSYFIRDSALHGSDLSPMQQKYGKIVAQGTISTTNPNIEFTLENGDTLFTFEIYVNDSQGHTTRDSHLYKDQGPQPGQGPTS